MASFTACARSFSQIRRLPTSILTNSFPKTLIQSFNIPKRQYLTIIIEDTDPEFVDAFYKENVDVFCDDLDEIGADPYPRWRKVFNFIVISIDCINANY
jgi:hypothetical protein